MTCNNAPNKQSGLGTFSYVSIHKQNWAAPLDKIHELPFWETLWFWVWQNYRDSTWTPGQACDTCKWWKFMWSWSYMNHNAKHIIPHGRQEPMFYGGLHPHNTPPCTARSSQAQVHPKAPQQAPQQHWPPHSLSTCVCTIRLAPRPISVESGPLYAHLRMD